MPRSTLIRGYRPGQHRADPQVALEITAKFDIDWPPYGYWTDAELAEMSRPCKEVRRAHSPAVTRAD